MKKHTIKLILLVISIFASVSINVFSQTTNVTATITDSDTTVWTNAQVSVSFQPNPNVPNINSYNIGGVKLTSPTYTGYLQQNVTTNGSGVLAVTLLDNQLISPSGSSWHFVIRPNASVQSISYNPIQVSGASTSLTAYLSTNSIAPRLPALPGAYAYADVEIQPIPNTGGQYFNSTSFVTRIWNGTSWQNGSSTGGTIPATTNVLKGNGTAGVSVPATAGVDYVVPSGNVATATAFFTNPSKCSPGQAPIGVDPQGNALTCQTISTGAVIPATNNVLKGSGTAGSSIAATPGSDYLQPSAIPSTSQVLKGNSSTGSAAIAAPQIDYNVPSAGIFYQSNYSTADLAFAAASTWATTNGAQSSLWLNCGTVNTANTFIEPNGLYAVNIHGCGMQGTNLHYTGSSAIPVIYRPGGGSTWNFLQITDLLIDGGNAASSCIDVRKLNQHLINNIQCQNIVAGAANEYNFGGTGADYNFQGWIGNLTDNNISSASTWPVITCTPVSGACTSWTITNGGAGLSSTSANVHEAIIGYQNGTSFKPCATLPAVPTLTINGSGTITAVTPTGSNGIGCAGTINLIVWNSLPITTGLNSTESDSTFDNITLYSGTSTAFYLGGGKNTFIHLHPATVFRGIVALGDDHFVGTECDSIINLCFEFVQYGAHLVMSVDGTVAYNQKAGSAVYYIDTAEGNINFGPSRGMCVGGAPSDWHEFVTPSGPIDTASQYATKMPSSVTVTGNDLVCNPALGDWHPLSTITTLNATTGNITQLNTNLSSIGHLGNGANATTSATLGTGAGTGATYNLFGTSSDGAGYIGVTTGTTPAASAVIVTINFSVPYTGNGAACLLYPVGSASAALSGNNAVYVSSFALSGLVINSNTTALAASTSFYWAYFCTATHGAT